MLGEKGGLYKKQYIVGRGIILCMMLILFGCSLMNRIEDKKQQQLLLYEADVKSISQFIDKELFQLYQSMSMFNNQPWVDKLASNKNVFEEEFTVFKRAEITGGLVEKKILHSWIKEVALIFPYKDTVVSAKGWYSMDEYRNHLKKSEEDFEQILDKVVYTYYSPQFLGIKGKSKFAFIESIENMKHPKGTAIFLVNEEELKRDILQMAHDQFLKLEIEINEGIVAEVDKNANPYYISRSANSEVFNLKYKFYYDKYRVSFMAGELMILGLIGIGYILLGLGISEMMIYLVRKPIKNVIANLHTRTSLLENKEAAQEDEIIEKYIENLFQEKEEMAQIINQYSYGAKNNFLIQLLKGYFNEKSIVEELEIAELKYSEKSYYVVGILGAPDRTRDSDIDLYTGISIFTRALKKIKTSMGVELQIVETLHCDTVIIITLPENNMNLADRMYLEILQIYQSIFNKISPSVLGSIEYGILGISKSYDDASTKKNELLFNKNRYSSSHTDGEDMNYYYPTDWEIQLINNVKISNLEVAQKILSQIKDENDKRNLDTGIYMKLLDSILGVFDRITQELGLELNIKEENEKVIILDQEDEVEIKWLLVYNLAKRICERPVYTKKNNNIDVAHQMLVYINANYTDSQLSLKKLANHFHISESGISKNFKEVYKVNFSDYIRRKRMEEAKRLLIETHETITVIASLVGYENEYSFKRAFMKYEGVKPSEYVLKMKENEYLTRSNKNSVL